VFVWRCFLSLVFEDVCDYCSGHCETSFRAVEAKKEQIARAICDVLGMSANIIAVAAFDPDFALGVSRSYSQPAEAQHRLVCESCEHLWACSGSTFSSGKS
jgi:hypothetical protein